MEEFSDESDYFEGEEYRLQPYQFEPTNDSLTVSESSSSDSEYDGEEDAIPDVSDWCRCDQCIPMPTANECRCCRTMNIVDQKTEGLQCITEHEGFQVNCLNIHVLETSYYEYVLDRGQLEEDQLIHELYRYLAYRRFTRWVYGLLSKKCRKVIPSCAVKAIRDTFPSEEYCGFKYPQ
ncbi:P2X purinoceptor 7-like [Ruditapes philippinarum]|uniref:P2X purinoceptor 7-like n=1 Tax=Ruditapes philippinarum TaxID=129788 RepID=UPI00295C108B|nr:P2X purinoceptor 7-like [Ruditapes philippinarum]